MSKSPAKLPTSSIPKSPITPSKLSKELWPPPSPPQTGDAALLARCRKLEVENGKLKSAQCVWDSEWTAFTRKLEAAEHRARDAEAEIARLRAESSPRSRASTLDEEDDDVDELERQLDTVGENERLTRELAAARARIAELERQLDRRTVENWPRERRGTRSPADARAPIELEISTPPPPPSSPLSSQSCPTPVVSGAFSGPGSRLWSMIARPGLLWLPPELQEIALSREASK
ncbi:unnamed protein product [Pelagomonas calceolata]|uniref:Uncharacterized protein n=1 Tax=Pelagomonas calceolata TaxID=35677 RepID=A0A8J2SUI7_9STRA|nr:unnamed protein product [Pelagomonas calceolata]